MDTCNAIIEFYYTHQKRFKCTHAKSLSNFIKPNIISILTHLYNLFNKFYWTQCKSIKMHTYIKFIEFCWTQRKRFKCTHTMSLLKFIKPGA